MSDQQPHEVDLILQKLEGIDMPHVPAAERRAAVERTIRLLRISSQDSIARLFELIDTNEEQLSVHSAPDDPQD